MGWPLLQCTKPALEAGAASHPYSLVWRAFPPYVIVVDLLRVVYDMPVPLEVDE